MTTLSWDDIIASHSAWKQRLSTAISKKEAIDFASLSRDDACAMGQWLKGDGKARFGAHSHFTRVVECHAKFHEEAGKVAATLSAGKFAEASAMLNAGTPFARASQTMVAAILAAKKEAADQVIVYPRRV